MRHIEDSEQKALIQWAAVTRVPDPPSERARMVGDYLFAIPNGGKRTRTEAARLKGLGVKEGVSDLLLPIPRRGCSGLWLEMKKPAEAFRTRAEAERAVTDNQRSWVDLMGACGFAAVVCYGWDDARREIETYLNIVLARRVVC